MIGGGYIYKLSSQTSGKSYVGYTTSTPEKRFQQHVNSANQRDGKGCRHLNNAIVMYGPDDFIIEHLFHSADASVDELKRLEAEMISQHDTLDPHGYNLTTGGDGFSGGVMPLAAREQLSMQHRIYNRGDDLGLNVCKWDQGKTPGFVVKVPGKAWKYFTNPALTYDERRDAAKSYRDSLINGGEELPTRSKKAELPYDLPEYTYYKKTQDGFNIAVNGVSKNFVAKGQLHRNLFRAMKAYISLVDPEVDDINWLKAYNIIEELRVEFNFE
jgi:hypothetical protein